MSIKNFSGPKHPRPGVNNPRASSAEVKEWSLNLLPSVPSVLHGRLWTDVYLIPKG